MEIINNKQYHYHNPTSFKGYTSKFGKDLSKFLVDPNNRDLLTLEQELKKVVKKKVNSSNLMGSGCHESVYRIDDKYVLKLCKNYIRELSCGFSEITKQKFSDIKSYFGEPLIRFGDIKILRNANTGKEHIPAGVPFLYSQKHTRTENEQYYLKKYLPMFADLPQRSFDNLVKDIMKLNKKKIDSDYYVFDFNNPNNFILSGKKIKVVDVISKTVVKNSNTAAELMSVFLGNMEIGLIAKYNSEAVPARRQLFKKILFAAEKYNLPLFTYEIDELTLARIFNDLCLGNKDRKVLCKDLSEIRKNNPDINTRLQVLNDYLEKAFSDKLA